MSTINSTTSVQDLAKTLLAQFDTNKDSQISTDEFSGFLTKLLSGINSNYAGTSLASSATKSTATSTTPTTGTSGVKFEGFDFSVTKDPLKSAKYSFAQAAKAAGTMPTNKEDAAAWFNANIKPKMEADGHTINSVSGDKFTFTNWQGTFTVDYIRGASSGNPALAWQVA
jgi:hypothetical protein